MRFWDTAAKATQHSDYWAGALLGRTEEGEWLIAEIVRGRWEYPQAREVVLRTAERDGPEVVVGIEESASGIALLQDLRRDRRAGGYQFWPLRVRAEKAVRAGAWASLAEGGLVKLARGGWNGPFLDEVETFPAGAHDDQVDAVTGAYELLLQREAALRFRPTFLVGRPRPMW